mmetsp:Transcript_14985/g.31777  ORF Transcript_14985/g.31777 Transcript_14985/m.31777 type:complete len:257 (-) Transcript_14985:181-951(-)
MAQSFWNAAAPLITITENHPFLVSMVDGSLPLDNFRYYVIQDALYLTDFADCLNQLGEKMKNVDEKVSKRLHEFATGAEEAEKDLHRSFFKQWDIDATNAKAMPNTLLYTSYMIRIVATRPIEEGLAVLLPCFWVYMHVGKCMLALRDKLDNKDNSNDGETKQQQRPPQFDAWIDMYGGEEFEREVKDYIAIVDNAAKGASASTLSKMEEHFIMSCKLEHMFWDQAQDLMGWPAVFDGKDPVDNDKKIEEDKSEAN